ncbi:beta-ketoacyl-[acyl-carrier-protein] synthase family protein [Planctomicrobium sp. SH668]|uniref:beta-ketoacyl-[acyl-carrier-protein] synthase family protein n=1 Tax=Planctomicrobium sp. SH668 TaxID=3448126 RepID=UPI003F5C1A2C
MPFQTVMNHSLSVPTRRRIAITGIGLVTPLGLDRESSWQGILDGVQAIDWLPRNLTESFPHQSSTKYFGGVVPDLELTSNRLVTLARQAAAEAVKQSGLTPDSLREAACVIGTSKVDLQRVDATREDQTERRGFVNHLFPSCSATAVSQDFHCTAGAIAPVAACATGLVSLIAAAGLIRDGHCNVVIAGSSDSSLHQGLLSSYRRLGVLAAPGDAPSRACRPFDQTRSGFAVGEGAAVLILEEWNHAIERGAEILAEWVDGIIGGDPSALTRVDNQGESITILAQRLLKKCGLSPSEIDAISLHGTATPLNDEAEAAGLRRLFAGVPRTPSAFAIKGAIGHLMGSAGSVETALCVLSLATQVLPPTVNHLIPEPDLPFTLHAAASARPLDLVLKLSLGFGGTIAAALLKRVPSTRRETATECD